jgi:glycine/D-amino acid oxidase-like deaminating enzyme
VLWLGHDSDPYTAGLWDVLTRLGVVCEKLTATDIRQRYPQMHFPDITWGVLEPYSGLLMARRSVQALVQDAINSGIAYLHATALAPQSTGRSAELKTGAGETISAGVLIYACGPWLPKLFPRLLGDRIFPTRQEVLFLGAPPGSLDYQPPRMPVWLHHTHAERPYALPDIENRGFKIAFDLHGAEFDPETGSRVVAAASQSRLRDYLKKHIPGLAEAPIVETRVCQYENTWNGDFLIDRHPEFDNVWFVGGGSGHGFKHGPAVGEYVCARILQNAPAEPRFSFASKQAMRARSVF